jgi:hypothetical protein
MRNVLRFLGFIFFSILTLSITAQENQRLSSSSQPFKFNDGIYTTIDMVRNNSPIPPNWIDADLNASNPIFYEEITKTDQIDFYDENGVRRFIRTNEVWGYCRKGVLYVHIGVKFYEIKYLGGVSFFKASEKTYNPPVPKKKTYINSPDYEYSNTTLLVNGKEYLIDLMENHYWEFGVGGLEYLLERDPQLLDEFNDLKKRKKKQMRYVFLIRYNEKHPFMISPE